MPRVSIRWSQRAAADLDAIVSYWEPIGARFAAKLLGEIADQLQTISEFPFSGQRIEGLPEHHRQIGIRHYRLHYLVIEDEQVGLIVTIRHVHQRPLTVAEIQALTAEAHSSGETDA